MLEAVEKKLLSLKVENWSYLNEGNANIIVYYIGTDPTLQNYVLRIPKSSNLTSTYHENFVYHQEITMNLISSKYLVEQKLVPVSSEFLNGICNSIFKSRPESRLEKLVDLDSKFVLITENVLKGNVSFELKPKCGYLPNSEYIRNEVKLQVCRYCLHKQLKGIDTKFCPIKLFSNTEPFIKESLTTLLSNPIKNLKLFRDSQHCEINKSILDSATDGLNLEVEDSLATISDILSKILHKESLLEELKLIQQIFDKFDIEGIKSIIDLDNFKYNPSTDSNLLLNFKSDSIDLDNLTDLDKNVILNRYLISNTFKDCSIVIQLFDSTSVANLNEPNCYPNVVVEGKPIYYRLSLIDLDKKPYSKMDYYLDLDKKLVSKFKFIDEFKGCKLNV